MLRIYGEIECRRAQGPADLQAELVWRIQALLDALNEERVDLTFEQNRRAFDDFLDAFVPDPIPPRITPSFDLVLLPSTFRDCLADMEAGGKVTFRGLLTSDRAVTATLERTVWLARGFAQHHGFTVVPRFRGNKIAPRSFVKCVKLYDALGVRQIYLRAAKSGTWYWSRWGFHFVTQNDLIRVIRHTQDIVNAFGADLDVSTFVHPRQFYELGQDTEITFADLIEAFPHQEDGLQDIATENGITPHQSIPFGRAVLLTGPSWDGCLDLAPDAFDRLIFDDVERKMVL